MSSFTLPLVVSPLKDGRRWKLYKEFAYHIGTEYSYERIKVPFGFVTDFASTDLLQYVAIILLVLSTVLVWFVPHWIICLFLLVALLSEFIRPYGKHGKAAVLHDFLYQLLSGYLITYENYIIVDLKEKTNLRRFADEVFYEAMLVSETAPWKAKLMFWGVRALGWKAWNYRSHAYTEIKSDEEIVMFLKEVEAEKQEKEIDAKGTKQV